MRSEIAAVVVTDLTIHLYCASTLEAALSPTIETPSAVR